MACDFRDYPRLAGIAPASLSLIITNPPLGRRIRIHGLRQLMADLFQMAATTLQPGGRLILTNPTRIDSPPAGLRLEERRRADLGGFDCRLENWSRVL
jgi:tRNA G10  N-methylase Trm11